MIRRWTALRPTQAATRDPLRQSGVQHSAHADLPALSSEELVNVLVRGGARVIARDERGAMVQAGRTLIFVRRTAVVDPPALADAVRASGIGIERFRVLLVEARGVRSAS